MVAEISRALSISQATFFKWKKKYEGRNIEAARRHRQLALEKARVKKRVANLMLDKGIMEEVLKKL